MFTLIKREIRDQIIYFIAAAIYAAILIIIMIQTAYQYQSEYLPQAIISIGTLAGIIALLVVCAMGVTQMYMDKTRKISAFLSTLAVSRNRILFSRIITGTLVILIMFVPLVIAASILIRLFPEAPVPIVPGVLFDISVTMFLMAFSCYCIGLQTGWISNSIIPTFGALGLTCILMPLVLVKGFGMPIVVILVLFIAASLIRIWQTFKSTSL
jgi:ABC-type transport system involved in multi-copper enzyme maturation permease subunit